jgi:hypothetical protein
MPPRRVAHRVIEGTPLPNVGINSRYLIFHATPPGHGAERREASDVADHVVAVNETEMKLGFRAQPRRAVRK